MNRTVASMFMLVAAFAAKEAQAQWEKTPPPKPAPVAPKRPAPAVNKGCANECARIANLEAGALAAKAGQDKVAGDVAALEAELATLKKAYNALLGGATGPSPEQVAARKALEGELAIARADLKKLNDLVAGGLDPKLVAASMQSATARVEQLESEIAKNQGGASGEQSLPAKIEALSKALNAMQAQSGDHVVAATDDVSGEILLEVVKAAPAEDKPVFEPTASFFSRYEIREDYAALGKAGRFAEGDMVRYRARLGLRTSPIDIGSGKHVIVTLTPQGSGYWADKGNTLGDGTLNLHEATVRLKGAKYWLDAGRFEMAYGEHLVIGTVGWHETARTFDGLRTHIETGDAGAYVDVFLTQVAEDPALVLPFGAGDQYFGGIYAGFGPGIEEGLEWDGYILTQIMPKTGGNVAPRDGGVEFTLGTRAKHKIGDVDLRGEAGVQFGAGSVDALAFQVDGEAGITVAEGMARIAAGAWYASGDDPTTTENEGWNQLYPTAHKFMGFMDIIGGRTNIAGGIARAKVNASPKFVLGADGHLFFRPETATGVDAYTGLEIDSWVLHKIGKGLGLRGGYSLFVPNEDGPYQSDNIAHYIEIQFQYDLK